MRTPRNGTAHAPEPAATPQTKFAASLAELIEQEFQQRAEGVIRQNEELLRQNEQLREEVSRLRDEVAAAAAMEERLRTEARAEMEAALERVLGGAKLR
jgi:cell division septum initiation protein DivIVA